MHGKRRKVACTVLKCSEICLRAPKLGSTAQGPCYCARRSRGWMLVRRVFSQRCAGLQCCQSHTKTIHAFSEVSASSSARFSSLQLPASGAHDTSLLVKSHCLTWCRVPGCHPNWPLQSACSRQRLGAPRPKLLLAALGDSVPHVPRTHRAAGTSSFATPTPAQQLKAWSWFGAISGDGHVAQACANSSLSVAHSQPVHARVLEAMGESFQRHEPAISQMRCHALLRTFRRQALIHRSFSGAVSARSSQSA